MNQETAEALEASIEKWKRNETAATPNEVRDQINDCPLCVLFHSGKIYSCVGCPVHKKTGEPYCRNTPYQEACEALHDWRRGTPDDNCGGTYRAAAAATREFLETLREPAP